MPGVEVDGVAWTFVPSLLDSIAEGKHFAIEPRLNAIRFGDGHRGQIPPEGAEITASYLYTLGTGGNVPAGTGFKIDTGSNLVASSLRQALESDVSFSILSAADATGGTDPTDLERARDEAIGALRTRWRAVTAQDFEDLVVEQAGLNVARARCFPEWDLEASDPYTARPGHVSVIVVPCPDDAEDEENDNRPEPSPEIITGVWDFLNQRRLITCRHHVVGPHYTDVCIRAQVVCIPWVSTKDVEDRMMQGTL